MGVALAQTRPCAHRLHCNNCDRSALPHLHKCTARCEHLGLKTVSAKVATPNTCVTLQAFTPWGLLSGALFVLSLSNSFLAIQLLDSVAIATGIWCGVAMVVSFIFGALVDTAPQSWLLAASAISLMVLAVLGITLVYLSSEQHPNDVPHARCASHVPRTHSALKRSNPLVICYLDAFAASKPACHWPYLLPVLVMLMSV